MFVISLWQQDENHLDVEMRPIRETFPTKPIFSVKDYSKEVLSWFTPENQQVHLDDIIQNNPKWRYEKTDVCRLFLSTLHLANEGKKNIT